MRRVFFIVFLFLITGCSPKHTITSDKWIVENKIPTQYGYGYLVISDMVNPTYIIRIEVGPHTFERTKTGDTITYSVRHY